MPKRITLASSVYEMALVTSGALLLGAYFFISMPPLEGDPRRFLAILFPLAALLCLQPRIFSKLSSIVLERLGRERLPATLPFAALILCVVLYAASFLLGGAAVLAMAEGLEEVGSIDVATTLTSFSVAYVVSVLAFILPAGLGAREAALAAALAPVMTTTLAVAVAVGVRVVQILLELILAGATSVVAARRRQQSDVPRRADSLGVDA